LYKTYCDCHCVTYYDGCNDCSCLSSGNSACGDKYCSHVEASYCLGCEGNMEWNESASSCLNTCTSSGISCVSDCSSRCTCPSATPIWNGTYCITSQECQQMILFEKYCASNYCGTYYDGCNNTCVCQDDGTQNCTQRPCLQPEKGTDYCLMPKTCPSYCTKWFNGCSNCTCSNGIYTSCETEPSCMVYTQPSCVETTCPYGMVWTNCASCFPTCANIDIICPLVCSTYSSGCICPADKPYFNNNGCHTSAECAAIVESQSFENCCKSSSGAITSSVTSTRKDVFCLQFTNQTSCQNYDCVWVCP